MNKINIPFKGMTNVPDDSFSQDGSMSVLLNMRHKGGELVQCQPPAKEPTVQVKQALYHAQSGQWLELKPTGQINIEGETVTGVTSFALMGSIVVLYKERSVEYAIWRNGAYVYLGELPEARISISAKKGTFKGERIKCSSNTGDDLYYKKIKKGYIDEGLYYAYKRKGYIDRAIFKSALRMFDGSLIPGNTIFCQLPEEELGINNLSFLTPKQNDGSFDYDLFRAKVNYFEVEITDNTDYGSWGDIIIGVDVYTSGSILSHKPEKRSILSNDLTIVGEYEDYVLKDYDDMEGDLTSSQYYRIGQFVNGKYEELLVDTSPSSLAQLDLMRAEVRHQNIGAIQVYNNRLHSLSKELLFNGDYGFQRIVAGDYIFPSPVTIYTQVTLSDNKVTAAKKQTFSTTGYSPVLSYPTDDASMFWFYEETGNYIGAGSYDKQRNGRSYLVNKANTLNEYYKISFVEGVSGLPNPPKDIGILLPGKYKIDRVFVGDVHGYRITGMDNLFDEVYEGDGVSTDLNEGKIINVTVAENFLVAPWDYYTDANGTKEEILEMFEERVDNIREEQPNVLKVSAVDNPFYYPTAQTYKFEGNIEGLASNAEAISTGQFGQYPLFVFTTEGIWAMAVDASGQGAYVSQSPFSREVCSGAVCPVSGGIVFTTARGVMAISGGQVTELSAPLDGLEGQMLENSDALMTAIFGKAGKDKDRTNTPVPIRVYLDGAKLAYNYLHNEVILSNTAYRYSYVYSLANQEWSMIDVTFDVTTNKYPELVVYNNSTTKRITFNDGNEANAVVAITRPVKVDTLDFKRLRQAALRCTFEGGLNFYVLGSNDGASFVCITGKEYPSVNGNEPTDVTRRDLITSMSRSKQYKYIAIAVAGNMKGRVSLTEMLVEGGFASNQLR